MLLMICEWCKIGRCDLCDEDICECEHNEWPATFPTDDE